MEFAGLAVALAGVGLQFYQSQQQASVQKEALKQQARIQAISAGRSATITQELMIAALVAVGIFISYQVIAKA